MSNKFGGPWTITKLDILGKYLDFYTQALKNQPFKLLYIDAFAGTGHCDTSKGKICYENSFFPELSDKETITFQDGSIKIALDLDRPFDEYIFVEKSPARFKKLKKITDTYRVRGFQIQIENGEANSYIRHLCKTIDWSGRRAVLFLDPFGMQVEWKTLETIAATQAIDMWFLCPVNAINRMLTKSGNIDDTWRNKLDVVFGTTEWYDSFYTKRERMTLFGPQSVVNKEADYESISNYAIKRLETIFARVSNTPKMLYNTKGQPLFMLCFAIGNPAPKAIGLALKAANFILKG